MKHVLRRISHLAVAMAAAAGVSNASAIIYNGGDTWSYLHNNSNGCVRAYFDGKYYDVAPHTTRQLLVTDLGYVRYQVSVFPWSTCGGKATKNLWFGNTDRDWWV